MTIEVALLISIVSVAFAVFFGLKNSKRQDVADIEKKAGEMATINTKLDNIGGDVKDIKYDISAVKKDVSNLAERVSIVEQSSKSMHKRLDQHIGNKERGEE